MTGGFSSEGGDSMERAIREQENRTAKLAAARRRRPARLWFAAISVPVGYAVVGLLMGSFDWRALGSVTLSALLLVLVASVLQRGAR